MAIALVTAAIIAGVAGYYKYQGGGEEKNWITQKVTRDDLVVSVSASGVIEPNFQVEVKSKASGEILQFDFEPGDRVSRGQTLLTLDQRTERRNLALQQADLARVMSELKSAKASLLEKELKLKRTRKLFEKSLVSDQELDSAVAAREIALARIGEIEALIAKAKLAVENASERLDETVIVSPIDGVIVEKTVERGQIISSGISSVTGGSKLCVIADLDRLFIFALVDETDIGKVTVKQKALVTVDAYADKAFEGVAERIYPSGETSNNITVFKVKVEILDQEKSVLRPKMTANVDMILDTRPNALLVPEEAVVTPDDGSGSFVYAVQDGRLVKKEVKTGLSNGFEIEIIEGLREGETISLLPPAHDDSSG